MEEIRDLKGNVLKLGDLVVTHEQWASDTGGTIGISICKINGLTRTGRLRLVLIRGVGLCKLYRDPRQVLLYQKAT